MTVAKCHLYFENKQKQKNKIIKCEPEITVDMSVLTIAQRAPLSMRVRAFTTQSVCNFFLLLSMGAQVPIRRYLLTNWQSNCSIRIFYL